MKPRSFDYHRPETVADVLALMGRTPVPRLLAGGQSLVPLMNQRQARVDAVVDLNGLDVLAGIAEAPDGAVRIGPMTRQAALETEPVIRRRYPEIGELLPFIGFAATRNRGTVGGSLAWADPAGELPALAVALGAEIELCSSAQGVRHLDAGAFFLGPFRTAARADELLTAVYLPARAEPRRHYVREVHVRATGRAVAGIIAYGDEPSGMRATLFGWNDRPRTLRIAGSGLEAIGEQLDAQAPASAWHSDAHGEAGYRRFLFASLLQRAWDTVTG